jgi:UDP-N-acetylmuramyl pentapeptide phosphotransferase/UDP-N-acetylglucosamine-1-phosphate transferase
MNPVTRLKLSSVFFTVFWIGGMVWWSGAFERANVIILSICGALAGYLWYRAMRWQFQLMGMLPRNEQ